MKNEEFREAFSTINASEELKSKVFDKTINKINNKRKFLKLAITMMIIMLVLTSSIGGFAYIWQRQRAPLPEGQETILFPSIGCWRIIGEIDGNIFPKIIEYTNTNEEITCSFSFETWHAFRANGYEIELSYSEGLEFLGVRDEYHLDGVNISYIHDENNNTINVQGNFPATAVTDDIFTAIFRVTSNIPNEELTINLNNGIAYTDEYYYPIASRNHTFRMSDNVMGLPLGEDVELIFSDIITSCEDCDEMQIRDGDTVSFIVNSPTYLNHIQLVSLARDVVPGILFGTGGLVDQKVEVLVNDEWQESDWFYLRAGLDNIETIRFSFNVTIFSTDIEAIKFSITGNGQSENYYHNLPIKTLKFEVIH